MQAKLTPLSVVLYALFVSQLVGALPKNVDCSLVRCAAVECPLGQSAQIKPGACCKTCVPCGIVPCPLVSCLANAARLASLLQIVLLFSVSPVTVPGQCCPTCKPKPDCKDVLCLDCVGEIKPGNCCPTCGLGPSQSCAGYADGRSVLNGMGISGRCQIALLCCNFGAKKVFGGENHLVYVKSPFVTSRHMSSG
ncbi:hypothetical protein B0H19DRAFT_1323086 [Mycena capillaripes]|nr:hypothetical protein B0H19DRAFT_1323086 [Mycena capillaripes]